MSLLRTKVLEMARELRESGKAEWQRRDTGEDSSEVRIMVVVMTLTCDNQLQFECTM